MLVSKRNITTGDTWLTNKYTVIERFQEHVNLPKCKGTASLIFKHSTRGQLHSKGPLVLEKKPSTMHHVACLGGPVDAPVNRELCHTSTGHAGHSVGTTLTALSHYEIAVNSW